ncbi:inactive peptidyl-prolyl cis-trans isomerase FKBP6-like [Sinocyclocheilus rhinocerous]|uniref:inactive peptidyl-prolyl cis-trans isomerase FKBP6-like n=1 Tax=Sinocyclocheilus rhinocerous TaxID=307959 RepID=UPI0007B82A1D|nr:PREDICTED: inactive peptidyl-prolyl cis-trans isomerase FKBP6-like [Sinocyclocheilus rhinocerous]
MSTNGKTSRILQFMAPDERRQFGIETPFQRLAWQMQDILGDGGILKEVVHAGEGPPVPKHASVSRNEIAFPAQPLTHVPNVSLTTFLNVLDTQRSFGNLCFNKKRYEDARERYKQAMTLLQNRELVDDEEKQRLEEMKLPFLLNLSLTYLKLEKPQKALCYGQKALDINPQNTKALFRCGQACLEMSDYEKAQDYLTLAQAKKPFDPDINTLLKKLALCYMDYLDKERDMCSKMFSGFKRTEN